METVPLAEVLPTHTTPLFAAAVQRAAACLRLGGLVALPTETVYGLAANALDAAAVVRIFQAKGRPSHNPIIVHISSLEMAHRCVLDWSPEADRLARAFWPGPLTLVLRASADIPSAVTAGGATVGVRWPSHPMIRAVIEACDFPLAAPSANRANEVSPTNASHVLRSLGMRIPLIVDGGQSQVGIESTVVDLTTTPATLLRPGMVNESALLAELGSLAHLAGSATGSTLLRSPGQLPRHYAPRARLVLRAWTSETELANQLVELRAHPATTAVLCHTQIPLGLPGLKVSVIPHDAEAFARSIYAELHQCDLDGMELIVVESVPDSSDWRAIRDRLQRASVPVKPGRLDGSR